MKRRSSFVLSLVAAALAVPAAAGEKRPMTPIDLLEVPQLRSPLLSPDGEALLYTLAKADWKQNKRITHIWRVDIDGSDAVQLTNGAKGESGPAWSPDGGSVAFIAKRGEDETNRIYVLPTRGGEAMPLGKHETDVASLTWAPNGGAIYFTAREPKTKQEKARDKAKDDVYAYDEDYKHRHLWKVDVDSGEETRITEGDYSLLSYALSRDGTRVAFHRSHTPLRDDSDEGEVWLMNADGSEASKLTTNTVVERGARLSPDNSQVLFTTNSSAEFETYYNNNLFVIPAAGGESRLLLADMPHAVQGAEWSADGESIYFVASHGVRRDLFRVDVASQELTRLTEGDHAVRGWHYAPAAGRHALSIDQPKNAGDVWTLTSDGQMSQVTHVFDYLDETFELPQQVAMQWKGEDGVEVEGLVYFPLGYEEGRRYPLVVQTHGGPASADAFGFGRWSRYTQVLAAMGWAVIQPNYRGSTGYGDEFLRDMVGQYFRQAHLDVMKGADHLIEAGIADPDRMVKMGWSAGGHMTNKIITHTDRFKAASSGAGAVNWISMYGQSDVRIYRTPWFGGTPWEQDAPIEVYWGNSPLKDIWKVKTPTLVLVGANDVRVPPPQSIELFRALRSHDVPTHLYMAPREPHGWRELRHELFKINVELEWFEKWARGNEYEWANAPADEEEDEDDAADESSG